MGKRRPIAALLVLLLVATMSAAAPAVGQDFEASSVPDARGIDHACEHVDDIVNGFPDIDGFAPDTQDAIECLAAYGFSQGYTDGTYRPMLDVQRYQMALFLSRVIGYVVDTTDLDAPDVEDQQFTDVAGLSEEAQDAVNLLGTLGVTTGTGDGSTFSPHAVVSRRDMASFMVRLQNVLDEGSYDTEESFFPDVPDGLARASDINALAAQGIVQGHVDGTYRPFNAVRRAEMALFLMRHIDENVEADRLPALFSDVTPIEVTVLSTQPWLVSGGDALVEIEVPPTVPLDQVTAVLNDDEDVSDVFEEVPDARALRGVVTGLVEGDNTLEGRAPGRGRGRPRESLEITNWPITGPIISGPHQEPFFCQTAQFQVAGGRVGQVLGEPSDDDCSIETRVDYLYKTTDGALEVLEDPDGPLPGDVDEATTIRGETVPYVVRLETGTVNRAIYEIAFLHEPGTPLPDPVTSTPGWNERIVYRQGGGCRSGWYVQGDDTGGVLSDELLSRGYATVAASLNRFANNCAELLSSETTMMVKEHFVDSFGVPLHTIGLGSSGGSYQSHHTADNYPDLFDGIFIGRSFPEVTFATNHKLHDTRLLKHYFDDANAEGDVTWSEEEQRLVSGFGEFGSIDLLDVGAARIDPVPDRPDRTSAEFHDVVPDQVRYHPEDNPEGARATVYDHQVNVFGRDPDTGFARRPLDNQGIQYGLDALNAGDITTEQFLDLNEEIGGMDIDANFTDERTEADSLATRLAYRGGRLVNGGEGLNETPVVDFRNYLDDDPTGDIHMRYHSFSMRERLRKANGDADNHVMITVDGSYSCGFGTEFVCDNPALWEAFDQLDEWLVAMGEDADADTVRAAKPADLVDACYTPDPQQRIVEEQTFDGPGQCNELYPAFPAPRIVAGSPIESDVIACERKDVDPDDYQVELTGDELDRLEAIFPDGVCDWTQPGLEQQPPAGVDLSVGPSPVNQIFDMETGQESQP